MVDVTGAHVPARPTDRLRDGPAAGARDTNPGFQPFGYAGGLYDHDTGLVRFGQRDYDPETGRWTVPDPLGVSGPDTNVYAYSANDPVNVVDPSGLWPKWFQDVSEMAAGALDDITYNKASDLFGVEPLDNANSRAGAFTRAAARHHEEGL